MKWILHAFMCWMAVSASSATPLEPDLVRKFREAVLAEVYADDNGEGSHAGNLMEMLSKGFPNEPLTPLDYRDALQATGYLKRQVTSKPAKKLTAEVHAWLEKAIEKEALEFKDTHLERVRSILREGCEATRPPEVDGPIRRMAELRRQARRLTKDSSINDTLETAHQALNRWQDVLLCGPGERLQLLDSFKKWESAIENLLWRLESEEARSGWRTLVRSRREAFQIGLRPALDQAEQRVRVKEILRGLRGLDSLEGALAQVREFDAGVRWIDSMREDPEIKAFEVCAENLRRFKEGLPVSYDIVMRWIRFSYPDRGVVWAEDYTIPAAEHLRTIWEQLVRLVVPQLLGVGPELALREKETYAEYFPRMAAWAGKHEDWTLMRRAYCLGRDMKVDAMADLSHTAALQYLQVARNFEQARQYREAVASYTEALKIGPPEILGDWIRERLEGIKASQPQAYEEALREPRKN
jgi:hypothetical protein